MELPIMVTGGRVSKISRGLVRTTDLDDLVNQAHAGIKADTQSDIDRWYRERSALGTYQE